jgi:hypothetical protein
LLDAWLPSPEKTNILSSASGFGARAFRRISFRLPTFSSVFHR